MYDASEFTEAMESIDCLDTPECETKAELADRLEEVKVAFMGILDHTKRMLEAARLSGVAEAEARRAESYWLAHLRIALDNEHQFLGGSMCTLQETLDELRGEDDES